MVQKHSTQISWDGLQAICLVARFGTVRRAAIEIGVAHTTMAKRVATAERNLGVVAFVRGPKGYIPTAAGQKVVVHAERMSQEAAAISNNVMGADTELAGKVRISLLPSVLSDVLAGHMGEFVTQYPNVQLEFNTDYALQDLDRNRADIAIRIQDQPSQHLWGRKVAAMYDAVYSSPEVFRTYKDVNTSIPTIGWTDEKTVVARAALHGIKSVDVNYVVADLASQADLALAGQGITILPCFVGDQRAGLVRYTKSHPKRINDVWVLSHPDFKSSARVQKVAKYLASIIQKQSRLFSGK